VEIEVRHLRILSAIASAGSLNRAAVALGLTQPALTSQLQRIERRLGGRLFERDRGGAKATALGELVLARSLPVLAAIDELDRDVEQTTEFDASRLRVTVVPGRLAGRFIHDLRSLLPRTQITAEVRLSGFADLLETGRIELALVREPPEPTRHLLRHALIAVEPMSVAVSRAHPLAGREIQLSDLMLADWLVPDDGGRGLRSACADLGFTPRLTYAVDRAAGMELVRYGDAVSLIGATARAEPGVAVSPLAGTPLWEQYFLAWRDPGPMAGYAEELITLATSTYKGLCAC
jgi:DNA-binding transcriptional LysR family regulator